MQESLRLVFLQEAGQGEELVILVVLNVTIIFQLTSVININILLVSFGITHTNKTFFQNQFFLHVDCE